MSREHVNSISAAHSDSHHSKSASIRGMRVSTYHHSARERIVLEHHLMNNASTGTPEANAIFQSHRAQEIVHLAIGFESSRKVFLDTHISTNQMVAMHRGGNCHTSLTGIHELQQSHLCRSVLHSHTVGTELHIINTTLEGFHVLGLIKMGEQYFLGVGQWAANSLACHTHFLRVSSVEIFQHFNIQDHSLFCF